MSSKILKKIAGLFNYDDVKKILKEEDDLWREEERKRQILLNYYEQKEKGEKAEASQLEFQRKKELLEEPFKLEEQYATPELPWAEQVERKRQMAEAERAPVPEELPFEETLERERALAAAKRVPVPEELPWEEQLKRIREEAEAKRAPDTAPTDTMELLRSLGVVPSEGPPVETFGGDTGMQLPNLRPAPVTPGGPVPPIPDTGLATAAPYDTQGRAVGGVRVSGKGEVSFGLKTQGEIVDENWKREMAELDRQYKAEERELKAAAAEEAKIDKAAAKEKEKEKAKKEKKGATATYEAVRSQLVDLYNEAKTSTGTTEYGKKPVPAGSTRAGSAYSALNRATAPDTYNKDSVLTAGQISRILDNLKKATYPGAKKGVMVEIPAEDKAALKKLKKAGKMSIAQVIAAYENKSGEKMETEEKKIWRKYWNSLEV